MGKLMQRLCCACDKPFSVIPRHRQREICSSCMDRKYAAKYKGRYLFPGTLDRDFTNVIRMIRQTGPKFWLDYWTVSSQGGWHGPFRQIWKGVVKASIE